MEKWTSDFRVPHSGNVAPKVEITIPLYGKEGAFWEGKEGTVLAGLTCFRKSLTVGMRESFGVRKVS